MDYKKLIVVNFDDLKKIILDIINEVQKPETTPQPGAEWLTAQEYGSRVNRSAQAVRRWARGGAVETRVFGGVTLYRWREV